MLVKRLSSKQATYFYMLIMNLSIASYIAVNLSPEKTPENARFFPGVFPGPSGGGMEGKSQERTPVFRA
jgi:hypothetical protein